MRSRVGNERHYNRLMRRQTVQLRAILYAATGIAAMAAPEAFITPAAGRDQSCATGY